MPADITINREHVAWSIVAIFGSKGALLTVRWTARLRYTADEEKRLDTAGCGYAQRATAAAALCGEIMRKKPIRLLGPIAVVAVVILWFFSIFQSIVAAPVHADDPSEPVAQAVSAEDLMNEPTQGAESQDAAAAATPTPALPTYPPQWAAYEASLPVPSPTNGSHYVVQLVNESNVTILGTANTANEDPRFALYPQCTGAPVVVEPREGTWVMQAYGSPPRSDGSASNVLTIDIPLCWENTKCSSRG